MKDRIVIAVTGHRPTKLVGGYDHFAFENKMITYVFKKDIEKKLLEYREVVCITGMAIGVDMLYAIACLSLKDKYVGRLKLICAVPFEGHGRRWSADHKIIQSMILESADAVVNTTGASNPPHSAVRSLMQKRNEWMVDNSDVLWALFDGSPSGTRNCVNYAKKQGKQIEYYTVGLIKGGEVNETAIHRD